jgi:hypothetical protein
MKKQSTQLDSSEKWLPLKELYTAMKEAGALWSERTSLLRYERKGKLTLPTLPDSQRTRVVTQPMINEIVQAFSPGGSGEWHYDKRKDTHV